MVELTNAQVLAAAAQDRLVKVVSAPGSGKTTIAAERYGYLRYLRGDTRGVLGLTFNRAAVVELHHRIEGRWGANCIKSAHRVVTFDHLHVELLSYLLSEGLVTWLSEVSDLDVCDDYRGRKGFRFLQVGGYKRFASLNANRVVFSKSYEVTKPDHGISKIEDHQAILESGTVSHEDVRAILQAALKFAEIQQVVADWLSGNYRALVIDEVYDADNLDLHIAYLAAESGLSVTLIGDPWQTLYKWRGAQPEVVEKLLERTSEQFVVYEQPESFRFQGDQMPKLANDLRLGIGAVLPEVASTKVDVALARNWTKLWTVGDNVLPLSFRTVNNATDAVLNLFLDVITRSRLGSESFGREGAITKLGIDREQFLAEQDEVFGPIVASLNGGASEADILDQLRDSIKTFGGRRPRRLVMEKETEAKMNLTRLAARLDKPILIPGLTIFQAKGREWDRVGVVLSREQVDTLEGGLSKLDEEHSIIYVAVTRARIACGRLLDTSSVERL